MTDSPKISACIIAMNEEDRIADCLRSLDWCDEIVVVDSHSTDRTRAVATEHGARVIERDWPGHVKQKEFAIRAAEHDWVLCVDADERVTETLRAEILALRGRGFPDRPGWRMPRLTRYLGRWIRHGWYPDHQLRLFDRRRGRWGGRDPHDKVLLDGSPGTLRGDLEHDTYRSFADHLRTIDRYSTIAADALHAEGRRAHPGQLVLRPAMRFVRFFVLKGGFLEGWRGLLIACLSSYYACLKYAKLMVKQRTE